MQSGFSYIFHHLTAGFTVLLLLILPGCVREGFDDCEQGIFLKLHAYEEKEGVWIGHNEFERLTLLVYDERGILLERLEKPRLQVVDLHTLFVPLKQGSYRLVLLGDTNDVFYSLDNVDAMKSRIDEGVLKLKRDGSGRVVIPPSQLYYGDHQHVTMKGLKTETVVIDVRRLTSDVRIVMRGLNGKNHYLLIEDNNGANRFPDFRIDRDDMLTYFPSYTDSPDDSSLIADFTVMKLAMGRHPILKLYSADGTLQKQWDLMDNLIGKYPDMGFETGHDYEIVFRFDAGYVAVSITVNGWEIIDGKID